MNSINFDSIQYIQKNKNKKVNEIETVTHQAYLKKRIGLITYSSQLMENCLEKNLYSMCMCAQIWLLWIRNPNCTHWCWRWCVQTIFSDAVLHKTQVSFISWIF